MRADSTWAALDLHEFDNTGNPALDGEPAQASQMREEATVQPTLPKCIKITGLSTTVVYSQQMLLVYMLTPMG